MGFAFSIKGLKSSGKNQYPMKAKLTPRFLLILSGPNGLLMLISLYIKAAENVIATDLTLTSPMDRTYYYLNLVMSSASSLSKFLHSWLFTFQKCLTSFYLIKAKLLLMCSQKVLTSKWVIRF